MLASMTLLTVIVSILRLGKNQPPRGPNVTCSDLRTWAKTG